MHQIILAGFGGQGILFAGKLLAYAGMLKGKEVSWLPSYGPEMRGGTANCSVNISEDPIASPVILKPDILVALNAPSLRKFEDAVVPGGYIIYDSAMISQGPDRSDVTVVAIPATQMAIDMGAPTLANVITVGKLLKDTNILEIHDIKLAMEKMVSARKRAMLDSNYQALELGHNF